VLHDISKGFIYFADISITSTLSKTSFQIFISAFLFKEFITFIKMYQGSVTHKLLKKHWLGRRSTSLRPSQTTWCCGHLFTSRTVVRRCAAHCRHAAATGRLQVPGGTAVRCGVARFRTQRSSLDGKGRHGPGQRRNCPGEKQHPHARPDGLR